MLLKGIEPARGLVYEAFMLSRAEDRMIGIYCSARVVTKGRQ
jgi:hypothetical protein